MYLLISDLKIINWHFLKGVATNRQIVIVSNSYHYSYRLFWLLFVYSNKALKIDIQFEINSLGKIFIIAF